MPPDTTALMLLWFIQLVAMELDWIQHRHGAGWISSAVVALWCPVGGVGLGGN